MVEDPDENLTPLGDVIRGGKGNDFIDGGEQGVDGQGEGNFNVAEYDGPARNFTFESKVYSEDADKDEIDTLIIDLGLENAADYLIDGQSYFIVTDSRGEKGQGTDIVANIQAFDFTDDFLTLEATTYTYQWSQEVWPDGFYISPGMTPLATGVMERPMWIPKIRNPIMAAMAGMYTNMILTAGMPTRHMLSSLGDITMARRHMTAMLTALFMS